MAYGVKYRLEFSDVLGYGKKVEILKKDYTGRRSSNGRRRKSGFNILAIFK